jgi:hypothetical protein
MGAPESLVASPGALLAAGSPGARRPLRAMPYASAKVLQFFIISILNS